MRAGLHPVVMRQLRRATGATDLEEWRTFAREVSGLADADRARLEGFVDSFERLLARVGDTYDQRERESVLLHRSIETSSMELSEVNERLRGDAATKAVALDSLHRTLAQLLGDAGERERTASDADLAALAERLRNLTLEREDLRRRLLVSEERLALAVAGANVGLWDWDVERGKVYFSARWKAMIGYGPDELPDDFSSWRDNVHPDDLATTEATLESYLKGTSPTYEPVFRFRHRDGHYLWVEARGAAVRDTQGRAVRMSGTHTDVTAAKAAEAELRLAKEAAESGSRAKSDFLASVSHELRTPMNGILGMLALLLDLPLDARHREYAMLAHSSAESLLALLNDLLDFSKIEAGKLDIAGDSFSPRELVAATARQFELRCRERGLALTVDVAAGVPDQICGDQLRLRQVLTNLLGNAAKFTERGGVAVRVTCTTTPSGERRLGFAVEDTGIGIPEATRSILFQPFTQGDGSISRRYGGTGLGLAISSRLVSLMGGGLSVESQPGVGSTFSFSLPVTEGCLPRGSASGKDGAARRPGRALKVLLAEDNRVNQRVAVALLEKHGHAVEVAPTGHAVLDAITRRAYDAILMDVQMPDMDGIEATRHIRERELTAGGHVRIIAMTANAYESDRQRCLDAGMDDFVCKPFRIDALLAALAPAAG
ncbi:MAG TPA: ATP-binding protein [Polyangia bacterium]|nr:ATP-binding protein [Polyangia bacterium]